MCKFAGRCRVKAVLHDEKLDIAKRMLEEVVVGERDCRIGGDEPERLDAALHRGFDDVWISETACGWNPLGGDIPNAGKLFAILLTVESSITGQRCREAGLAGAHGVALPGDGERRGSRAADVAGD